MGHHNALTVPGPLIEKFYAIGSQNRHAFILPVGIHLGRYELVDVPASGKHPISQSETVGLCRATGCSTVYVQINDGWPRKLRLTGLLASLSLATDLGTGQPLGHGLRTSLLSVLLARELGLTDDDVRSVQQVGLLRFLGCTADAAETAQMASGDDVVFNATFAPALNGTPVEAMGTLVRAVGPGKPILKKGRMVLAALADTEEPARGLAAHCEVAAMLARRLGLQDRANMALHAAYERWDGKGYPNGLEGEAVPIEIRIAVVARDIDVFKTLGRDVTEILRRRRGRAYDPPVVDAYERLGRTHPEAERLRCAGLVHDVGRVGVSNGIWDKPGPLSTGEFEKVRLHPYLTDRILSRCPELMPLGALATSHHERLDGSGYHRQSTTDHLPTAARLLASADVMAALMSPRPHREPLDVTAAADLMRAEAREGRLDKDSVESVVAAAGGQAGAQRLFNLGGLTDRECEVLQHLCRGFTNRQVAEELLSRRKRSAATSRTSTPRSASQPEPEQPSTPWNTDCSTDHAQAALSLPLRDVHPAEFIALVEPCNQGDDHRRL
ncbi:MAG: HD domain-containing phosphohydrolase [Acidimicrobiales bacterium]